MEKFSALLFEFSHEDRLRILYQIQKNAVKLTTLSEKLNLKVQETSRHLSRLGEAKLVLKDSEGLYHLTPYGDHAMRLLPGFDFLCKHRNYFATHRSSHLPEQFVSRIGELNKCTFMDSLMVSFQEAKTLYEEAKERVWFLAGHLLPDTLPLLENAMKRGVKVRLLLPGDMAFPPGFHPIPFVPNRIEIRTLDRVDVNLRSSEKKGLITFPTLEGKTDHTGFASSDEISSKWCADLFEYYWDRGKIGTPKNYNGAGGGNPT